MKVIGNRWYLRIMGWFVASMCVIVEQMSLQNVNKSGVMSFMVGGVKNFIDLILPEILRD